MLIMKWQLFSDQTMPTADQIAMKLTSDIHGLQ